MLCTPPPDEYQIPPHCLRPAHRHVREHMRKTGCCHSAEWRLAYVTCRRRRQKRVLLTLCASHHTSIRPTLAAYVAVQGQSLAVPRRVATIAELRLASLSNAYIIYFFSVIANLGFVDIVVVIARLRWHHKAMREHARFTSSRPDDQHTLPSSKTATAPDAPTIRISQATTCKTPASKRLLN
ncbi:hypothetical protein BST61_g3671 [Cercospora zeina]